MLKPFLSRADRPDSRKPPFGVQREDALPAELFPFFCIRSNFSSSDLSFAFTSSSLEEDDEEEEVEEEESEE